jgi:hypothetical protein
MDHPEPAFGEDGDVVSVWVGTFCDQSAVDVYTDEQYDEDRDDEPISEFGADIGLRFYDHDFLEMKHCRDMSSMGNLAFARHSYGESFGETAWEAAVRQNLGEFDTVFMLYGYDHVRYPQANRKPERVKFVGTFPFRKSRDEWSERLIAADFHKRNPAGACDGGS